MSELSWNKWRNKKALVGANEVDKKVLKGVNRDESVL